MGLFRRERQPAEPDPALPLDLERAARLRRLVRECSAEAGVELVLEADQAGDDSGRRFGLWNLAAACRDLPERQWRGLVANHVRIMLSADGATADRLTDDQLAAVTYLRLMELDQLRSHAPGMPREERGDSVAVVLAVDLPETVATPTGTFWADRGGVERWREVGGRNLQALVRTGSLRYEHADPEPAKGGAFEIVSGDSFFTASAALLIEDLARRFDPRVDLSRGVLVAAPFRHLLAYDVVTPGADAALTLRHLFEFAIQAFGSGPGPISPHVFLVREGGWKQATAYVDGVPVVQVDDDLARALGISGDG